MKTNNQVLTRFADDLKLRGMSENTQRCYKSYLAKFLDYTGKTATEIDVEDARKFLLHLLQKGKQRNASINAYNAAIRFFFAVTLNCSINYLQMPRLKREKSLPEIFTRHEIQMLITNCANQKHKSFFLLLTAEDYE